MNRYHFNIRINVKDNNAGSKATEDCRTILTRNGFKDLEIHFKKVWYLMPLNFLKLLFGMIRHFASINFNSFIVVQYPLLGINRYFKYYTRLLRWKGCRLCCIIHDLDSLRSEDNDSKIKRELDNLAAYDAVIAHNPAMTGWLKSNGYKGKVQEILLFDYLAPDYRPNNTNNLDLAPAVVFAGNLARGSFINKLAAIDHSYYLNLYGPGFKKDMAANNPKIKWCGSYSPEEIVNKLEGNFGLIWDGDSIDEISGLMGDYIRYNTPHKTSLYLAAGIPVIISKKAAIARFVETGGLGICVNSLSEIDAEVLTVNGERYKQMKEKVQKISKELRDGFYLQQALIKTERSLFKHLQD